MVNLVIAKGIASYNSHFPNHKLGKIGKYEEIYKIIFKDIK